MTSLRPNLPAELSLLIDPPDAAEVRAACDMLREAGMDRMADALALAMRRPAGATTGEDAVCRRAALARLPPIFAVCLGSDGGRYDLGSPFRRGDHVYATDGTIAVREPVPDVWDLPDLPDRRPPVESIFAKAWSRTFRPAQVPEVDRPCPMCGGCGVAAPARCRCDNCRDHLGRDWRPCDACRGSGVDEPDEPVELDGGFLIGRGFAAILRKFGVAGGLPESVLHPMTFTAGPVEGLLMPIRPERRQG